MKWSKAKQRALKAIPLMGGPGRFDHADGPMISENPKRENISPNKKLCIMEAISYVAGEQVVTDAPVCVSQAITNTMIERNDCGTADDRERLRELAPAIIGTAPTKTKTVGKQTREYMDRNNTEYTDAEEKRHRILTDARNDVELPFEEFEAAIREAADVRRF